MRIRSSIGRILGSLCLTMTHLLCPGYLAGRSVLSAHNSPLNLAIRFTTVKMKGFLDEG